MHILNWWWKIGSNTPRSKTGGQRGRGCRLSVEELESRLAPAVALSYGGPGTNLILTELVNGATPQVTISDGGTNVLTIQLSNGTFDASSSHSATGLTYAGAMNSASSSATIVISNANNIATLLTQLPGDQLVLGSLADSVGGLGNIAAAAGSVSVASGATVSTSAATAGNGNLSLYADTSITLNSGATLTSGDGSITLAANQDVVPQAGNFSGITVDDATVQTTGVGNVLLQGTGGNDPASVSHTGVAVDSGTVGATGSGAVTIIGSGGAGAGTSEGVLINGAAVTSVTGPIHISGTGGSSNDTHGFNHGVVIDGGGAVTASGAADISIQGAGGSGSVQNFGVNIGFEGTIATVASAGGNICIAGTGGGSGGTGGSTSASENWGVEIGVNTPGTTISTTGQGTLTVCGTGGTGTGEQFGLKIVGLTTVLSTVSGAIQLTGTGGTGTGTNNFGVSVESGGVVTSTSGAITVNGTGGSGTADLSGANDRNDGVTIQTSGVSLPKIATGGNITLNGAVTDGQSNAIEMEGLGTFVPAVSATGSGSVTLDAAQNVFLVSALVSTVDGPLTVLANRGPTPASGDFIGIYDEQASIETTGAGNILLQGTGGSDPTTSNHVGVTLRPLTTLQATGTGSITIVGTGGSGAGNAVGVSIIQHSTVSSTTGPISITGTGGADAGGGNIGISATVDATVTSTSGAITLTGTGGPGTGSDGGVLLQSTDALTTAGAIALAGTVTDGTSNAVEIGSTTVNAGGNITLTGSPLAIDGGTTITGSALLLQAASPITLSNAGTVSVSGNVVAPANTGMTNDSGGTFTVGGSFRLGEFSDLTTLAGSTCSVAGTLVMGPDSSFADAGTLSVGGAFDPGAGYPGVNDTVSGTFNAQAGSSVTTDNATCEVLAGGHLDVAAGARFAVPIEGTLQNDAGGLITIEGTMTDSGTLASALGSALVVDQQGSLGTKTFGQLDLQGTYLVWNNPAVIGSNTVLSSAQLDATAMTMLNGSFVPLPGTLTYTPASGTLLPVGPNQALTVTFTPTDTSDYASATAQVLLNVLPAPTVSVNPVSFVYGTALANSQLSGTAIYNGQTIPGTYTYTAAGAILHAGNGQSEAVTFTPTDSAHYATVTTTVTVNVAQATPTTAWANPAPMPYATPLTGAQLDATASVPGTFSYNPAAGTVLPTGIITLSATFTPADATDYASVTRTPQVTVIGPGVSVVGTELWVLGSTTGSKDQVQISPNGSSKTGSTGVTVTGTLNGTHVADTFTQSFTAIRVWFYGANSLNNVHIAAGLTAGVTRTHINVPPIITQVGSATPNPVTGTTVGLRVQAADPQGGNLSYSWAVTSQPAGAASPTFNNHKSSLPSVTFLHAGSYTFTVTVTDVSGLSVSSSVTVIVMQTLTKVSIAPGKTTLANGATQPFTALAVDQFGNAMATQPTFTWRATAGTISGTGLYTAPATGSGHFAVTVSANGHSAVAGVIVS